MTKPVEKFKKSMKTLATTVEISPFDTKKFYLGKICKRGHQWGESRHSLRYKIGRSCIDCLRERNTRKGVQRRADPSPEKLYAQRLRRCARAKHCIQEPYTYEELQEQLAAFNGEWAYCGVSPMPCPHCGESKLNWNHLDMSEPNTLYNLVRACGQCSASRNREGFRDWYRKQSSYSPEREKHIMQLANSCQEL